MSVNNKIFNNLKIHTQYSICEGAIKIDELADFCKSNKIKSLGLADSYNLCGALEFSEKLSKVGTQPIIGTQIKIKAKGVIGKITLYATTENFLDHFNIQKLSDLPTIDELGSAGLIDTSSIDKSIFGTGKFFKEQSSQKKENIYSDIEKVIDETPKSEE